MALEQHISVDGDFFTGEDKSLIFTVYQADETTAQDISGWSLSWLLKRHRHDADVDALITKTTTGGGIALTTPLTGICTVTVADTDTDSIPAGTYRHELKRTGAGVETILAYGSCVLRQALHRA